MASLSSVTVSHSSITCLLPTKTHSASTPHPLHCPLRRRLLSLGNRTTTRRSFSSVRASQDDVVSVVDPPPESEKSPGFELVPYLKLKLLVSPSIPFCGFWNFFHSFMLLDCLMKFVYGSKIIGLLENQKIKNSC